MQYRYDGEISTVYTRDSSSARGDSSLYAGLRDTACDRRARSKGDVADDGEKKSPTISDYLPYPETSPQMEVENDYPVGSGFWWNYWDRC